MVYIFEGLPGAGKTSLINNLCEQLHTETPEVLPEYLPGLEGDRSDISFYIDNEARKSLLMKENSSRFLFTDRYWQSTAVYCSASSNALTVDELMTIHKINHKQELFNRYFYIYLRISAGTSVRRAQIPDVPNMWNTPSFARRSQALYDLLFLHIPSILPETTGRISIDMEKNTLHDAVEILTPILLNSGK
jgi:thymidylate kinase